MEFQAQNRAYFDPYNLSIKQINSLDIIQPTYVITSSFAISDSQAHLASSHNQNDLFSLTPLKTQHTNIQNELRFGKYQNQQNPLQISYHLDVKRPSPPSIENIVMQNQRKEQIQNITARFVNKIEDIFNDYPQFCSLEIKTDDLTHHTPDLPHLTSNTSLTDPLQQQKPNYMFYQPEGSFKLIESETGQRNGSGQDTKWSEEGESDHKSIDRDDLLTKLKGEKDKSIKLEEVLNFLRMRQSRRVPVNAVKLDKQTLRTCLQGFIRS